MKFLQPTAHGAASQVRHLYQWQDDSGEAVKQFILYRDGEVVAKLHVTDKCSDPATITMGNDRFFFCDTSSFFTSCFSLIRKEKEQPLASIQKYYSNTREGLISITGQGYAWRFPSHPGDTLMLMNHQRVKLFSYHYKQESVRLLMNGNGVQDQNIVLLLCIGLYLLPVWHDINASIAAQISSQSGQRLYE